MKRFFLLSWFFLCVCIQLYSDEYGFLDKLYYHPDDPASVLITDNQLVFDWDTTSSDKKDVRESKLSIRDGYTILFTDEEEFIVFDLTLSEEKIQFLNFLTNDIKKGNWADRIFVPFYFNTNRTLASASVLQPVNVISASAYLKEKFNDIDIEYIPKKYNGAFNFHNVPWVVTNIGNWIEFVVKPPVGLYNTNYLNINNLVFCNGYTYPGRLDLYKKNARVKKITIYYDDIKFTAELEDKPGYQAIELPKSIKVTFDTKFTLYIDSVYPGTKFSDIALSAILFPSARLKSSF